MAVETLNRSLQPLHRKRDLPRNRRRSSSAPACPLEAPPRPPRRSDHNSSRNLSPGRSPVNSIAASRPDSIPPRNVSRQIEDAKLLAAIGHQNSSPNRTTAAPQDRRLRFRRSHKVSLRIGMSHGQRQPLLRLLLKDRRYAPRTTQHIAQPDDIHLGLRSSNERAPPTPRCASTRPSRSADSLPCPSIPQSVERLPLQAPQPPAGKSRWSCWQSR